MIRKIIPKTYTSFRCLAGACPDTCCQQWDIDVDKATLSAYESLQGPLGEKIRSHLHEGEDGPVITLEDGQCPMHRKDGLCEIQASLGEELLCQVCRDFPRLTHDYGSFQELGLELSCPEAARLLLTEADNEPPQIQECPGTGDCDLDEEALALLLKTRDKALSLFDSSRPLSQALTLLLFYGLSVQQMLDGEEGADFSSEDSLETAQALAQGGDFSTVPRFFGELDVLTEEWTDLLSQVTAPRLSPLCRNLARYLISRYWLQAVSDYDLYCRVKFILISCLLVSSLPGDFIWNAHLFSKEIENDCENVEAILDGAYSSPVFTDARLLGYLQQAEIF